MSSSPMANTVRSISTKARKAASVPWPTCRPRAPTAGRLHRETPRPVHSRRAHLCATHTSSLKCPANKSRTGRCITTSGPGRDSRALVLVPLDGLRDGQAQLAEPQPERPPRDPQEPGGLDLVAPRSTGAPAAGGTGRAPDAPPHTGPGCHRATVARAGPRAATPPRSPWSARPPCGGRVRAGTPGAGPGRSPGAGPA